MEPVLFNRPVPHQINSPQPLFDHRRLVGTRFMQRAGSVRSKPVSWPRMMAGLRAGWGICWHVLLDKFHRPARLLTVSETVQLGDRRTVSIVQFGIHRFLIGCAPSSVTLLSRLPDAHKDDPAPAICKEKRAASEGG
jgi:hypothetical protein